MLAIVTVIPFGKGSSIAKTVAEVVGEVEKSGLDYRLTAMGTILEGEWDEVMRLVKRMRDRALKGADRLHVSVVIDDKKDRRRRIEDKVLKVEEILGKKLKK